ncbi:hypothetical protein PF004_g25453 [Phytophthora fragariae]|uniref:Uncharacterized protein n=1 Tax=Phytophthora fragariae TaxID=53985 RepID=A0A6G0MR91_9STRA|nr:hypothetical protein PF004_g25453 [Phytophthora fragariae]
MLELTPADFTDAMMSPGPPAQGERMRAVPAEHKLTEFPDWQRRASAARRASSARPAATATRGFIFAIV